MGRSFSGLCQLCEESRPEGGVGEFQLALRTRLREEGEHPQEVADVHGCGQDFGLRSVQVTSTGKWMNLPRALEDQWFLHCPTLLADDYDLGDCQVTPTEQAEVFLCMAQAVFISYR